MRLRNDWQWLWNVTIGTSLLLILAVALLACGERSSVVNPPVPSPVACGDGLAAVDLSGVCRATPQATTGALEVVP